MGFFRQLLEGDETPDPRLDSVSDDLRRLKIIWAICCTSPLLYLAAAKLILYYWFSSPEKHGLLVLSPRVYHISAAVFGAIALAGQVAIPLIRRYFRPRLVAALQTPEILMDLYGKCTFLLLGVSETTVLLGFFLFLAHGDLMVILPFGIAGLIYYGQSYPSRRRLVRLTRRAL